MKGNPKSYTAPCVELFCLRSCLHLLRENSVGHDAEWGNLDEVDQEFGS